MVYQLTEEQRKEIDTTLPKQIAALKDEFPETIYNLSDHWHLEPLPQGYEPEWIDVYYRDDQLDQPGLSVVNGKLTLVDLREVDVLDTPSLIYMAVEDLPAYISIGSMVIFNRLGGAILPHVLFDHTKLAELIISNWPGES